MWDLVVAGTGNYALFTAGDLARFVASAPAGRGPFELQIERDQRRRAASVDDAASRSPSPAI